MRFSHLRQTTEDGRMQNFARHLHPQRSMSGGVRLPMNIAIRPGVERAVFWCNRCLGCIIRWTLTSRSMESASHKSFSPLALYRYSEDYRFFYAAVALYKDDG
jgi:hypothetical protein